MALMPVEEALERILSGAAPRGAPEMLALADCFDRVLARDLAALRTHPPFAASAMDGYAVRAAEAVEGAVLAVQGESAAGHGFDGALEPGSAIRIFTGAPVPQGADTIIIQEMTERLDDGSVRINEAAVLGRHIRKAGVDFETGQVGLEAGRLLDAGAITFAAAMNHSELPVARRPRVAVLATGDELRLPGQSLGPGQIIASNTFGVAALARGAGGRVIDLGIAADRMEALDAALDSAIAQDADVLVTIGGASVGDHDLVQKAMMARGMALDFWKIAMRPGKPLMSGRLGAMQVIGLPGNPASSLVCAHL
ncbi:MAG: molybdopterin molybdotransferase MoeA, partial [Hoeflea sp.]|uniref:molybdopterin molybdotransferase MoeA n=1 Tax=Hoeflea sp. TaxID=1940281 RepID=UPI0027322852